LSTFDYILT